MASTVGSSQLTQIPGADLVEMLNVQEIDTYYLLELTANTEKCHLPSGTKRGKVKSLAASHYLCVHIMLQSQVGAPEIISFQETQNL